MSKMFVGVLIFLALGSVSLADSPTRPDRHPCTKEQIPLTTEKAVVQAVECLYKGRVAKVTRVDGRNGSWFYQLRILISGGRVKTVDVNPETGLPLDSAELEAVYEALNR